MISWGFRYTPLVLHQYTKAMDRFLTKRFLIPLVTAVMCLSPCLSHALTHYDFQSWNRMLITGPLAPNFKFWFEAQGRFGDDVSRLSQAIIRPAVGYKLSNNSSLWLGYAWITTQQPFAPIVIDENRIWQQWIWTPSIGDITVLTRTRLEQRFIERVSPTLWRIRQLLGIKFDLPSNSKFFIDANDEFFMHLNKLFSNRSGLPTYFDQNRFFIGLGVKASPSVELTIGYLNQHINRRLRANYTGDYLAMNLSIRL